MKFVKFFAAVCAVSMMSMFQACNCEDVNIPTVDWTEVETNPTLVGMVTLSTGEPVAGATVTINLNGDVRSAKTTRDGNYVIDNLEEGTYEVTVVSPNADQGEKKGRVTLLEGKVAVFNALFVKSAAAAVSKKNVTIEEYNEETGETETVKAIAVSVTPGALINADFVPAQTTTITMPEGALEDGDELVADTYYDAEAITSQSNARATSSAPAGYHFSGMDGVVVVNTVAKSGATTTKKYVTIAVESLDEPDMIEHGNNKDDIVALKVTKQANGNYLTTFKTKKLGETRVYYRIYVNNAVKGRNVLTFAPSMFEGPLEELASVFKYNLGVSLQRSNTYLDQFVILYENAAGVAQTEKMININFEVPLGAACILNGYQETDKYTYACGKSRVTVTTYGDIFYNIVDREHTGGGSN